MISAVEFVGVFTRMARQGKSALEIGQALGIKGDAKKVAIAVSVKASQLRKILREAAEKSATEKGLVDEERAKFIQTMEDKLPRLRPTGRPSKAADLVSAIDAVLAELDAPDVDAPVETPVEAPVETPEVPAEAPVEVPAEVPVEAVEKPKRKRGLLG